RGASSVRPDEGAAAAREPFAAGRNRARAAFDDSSHRFGRVVNGGVRARTGGALRSLYGRTPLAASRAADHVRGLRRLAGAVAPRRRARRTAQLLESATRRRPAAPRTPDRQAAPAGAILQGRSRSSALIRISKPVAEGVEPSGGGDAVHDPAGRLRLPAPPLFGAARHPRRHA